MSSSDRRSPYAPTRVELAKIKSLSLTTFWNDLIKNMPDSRDKNLFILLLSSYGSPSAVAVHQPGLSPVFLSPQCRVSIRPLLHTNPLIGLYFTRKEFDDVLRRYCLGFVSSGQPFFLSENAGNYVWKFTNGHPSAVRFLLEILAHSPELRKFRVQREIVLLKEIESLLNDNEAFFDKIMGSSRTFIRSLPQRRALQEYPELSDTLRQVLASGSLSGGLGDNPGLLKCYRKGWLQAELEGNDNTVYYFPTHIRRKYAEFLLQGDLGEFPFTNYPTLRHLTLAALRNFSRTSLLSAGQGLTTAATKIPFEAQFQDETYRAVYHTLGQKIFLTSEWGAYSNDGRVDFLLKKVKWGIECAREGNRLDEHIQRFLPGGRHYILIDFRKSMPKISKDVPFLIYVVHKDDFSSYEVFDATLKWLGIPLSLLA